MLQQSPPSNWQAALLFSSSQYLSPIQLAIQLEGAAVVGAAVVGAAVVGAAVVGAAVVGPAVSPQALGAAMNNSI